MTTPQHRQRPTDRELIEEAIARFGAGVDELQRPRSPRGLLPYSDHVDREERLLPALVTVEAWLRQVKHDHEFHARCGWCDPTGVVKCWAHTIAARLLGVR